MVELRDEEWLRDIKECEELQLESENGDFSFDLMAKSWAYAQRLKARRAAELAAVLAGAPRKLSIEQKKKPSGLTLASARSRTLILRARPDAGHTCGSSAEEPLQEDVARQARPASTVRGQRPRPHPARERDAIVHAPRSSGSSGASASSTKQELRIAVASSIEVEPHDLLLSFLEAIGVDITNPRLVKGAIQDRTLNRAVIKKTNYAAKKFFTLLRSHRVRFWGVDELRAAGDKMLGELRKRHVSVAELSRKTGISRPTIRAVGRRRHMRMSTLMAIGAPAGFLDGPFSKK